MGKAYIVFETNADQQMLKELYQGPSFDIAEHIAMKAFMDSYCQTDIGVWREDDGHATFLFSDETKRLRGECLG